jgi:hypothetical protein
MLHRQNLALLYPSSPFWHWEDDVGQEAHIDKPIPSVQLLAHPYWAAGEGNHYRLTNLVMRQADRKKARHEDRKQLAP